MSSSEIGVLLYLTPRNYLFKRADMLHMVPGPGQFEVVRRAGESKQHHGKLLAHIMASTPTVTWMTALTKAASCLPEAASGLPREALQHASNFQLEHPTESPLYSRRFITPAQPNYPLLGALF